MKLYPNEGSLGFFPGRQGEYFIEKITVFNRHEPLQPIKKPCIASNENSAFVLIDAFKNNVGSSFRRCPRDCVKSIGKFLGSLIS